MTERGVDRGIRHHALRAMNGINTIVPAPCRMCFGRYRQSDATHSGLATSRATCDAISTSKTFGARSRSAMGSKLVTMGSAAAGRGQPRWRRWSVAVSKVARWLAFCTQPDESACQCMDPYPDLKEILNEISSLFRDGMRLSALTVSPCALLETLKFNRKQSQRTLVAGLFIRG